MPRNIRAGSKPVVATVADYRSPFSGLPPRDKSPPEFEYCTVARRWLRVALNGRRQIEPHNRRGSPPVRILSREVHQHDLLEARSVPRAVGESPGGSRSQ